MTEIKNLSELLEAIKYIHIKSNGLCKSKFNRYFSNAGNIGIFCQSQTEYEKLIQIQKDLVYDSKESNRKYFELKNPINFPSIYNIPQTEYKYLYIRKVDESHYGLNRGDIDFYDDEQYDELVKEVLNSKDQYLKLSEQVGVGSMIQISDPETRVLAYISTTKMTELIRFRH